MKKPNKEFKGAPPDGAGGPPNGMMGGPPSGFNGLTKGKYYTRKGTMPAQMRAMAPDFTKIHTALFFMNLIIVIGIFIVDLILYKNNGTTVTQRELITGTAVNFAIVLLQGIVFKTLRKIDIVQHVFPILVHLVICTNIAIIHENVGCLTVTFCIPIFITVIYYNNGFIFATSAMSIACAVIASVARTNVGEDIYLKNMAVSIAVIICAHCFSEAICHMMNDQKAKMASVIMEAKMAQAEALEANKAKSLFLANMSHEIRTPINAILGMNEMILREEKDTHIREYASNIYSSGNLLLSIINDVLDISKIESGKFEITTTTYDVSSLINDCYNMTVTRAKKKNLELKVDLAEDLPRLLCGDEAQIRQIIVNLLTNAVKYTDEGGVIFMVMGTETKDGNDEFILTVSVRDTGIGISEEGQKQLFEQFTRLDLEHNRNIEGTGLGLTIVKHLVDMMDGEISVRSELGKGSEFTVKIPQKIIDRTPTGKIELNYTHSSDYEYVHSFEAPDAHILVVDDMPINLMVITNMLKDTSIHLDTAKNGSDAIELTKKNKYDLILMDHMMPELDGIQTYKAMLADERCLCRETPVIMLTANALSGVRERYINEGFADYLSKPVRGDKLEEMMKKHLPPSLIKTVPFPSTLHSDEPSAEESPAAEESGRLAALTDAIPELNLKTALSFCCEDEDFFIDILREYADSPRYDEMTKQYEEKDFDGYRINAHSLKSSSMTIGLSGLSERARASEFALKNDDTGFVEINHTDLMEMYKSALDRIKDYLSSLDS